MTVYVAMIAWYYEGYQDPIGVFSTLAAAKKACLEEESKSIGKCYCLDIYKFKVDGSGRMIPVKSSKGKVYDVA